MVLSFTAKRGMAEVVRFGTPELARRIPVPKGSRDLLDAFVRSQIEALHPGTKIVAGGASLGGILATAVADDAPEDYDGFILWEGMLNTPDPAVRALNQGYCAALEAQLAAGASFDSFISIFREVPRQAAINPSGLTPIALFPPTLTNHHIDHFMTADHRDFVERPIYEWAVQVFGD